MALDLIVKVLADRPLVISVADALGETSFLEFILQLLEFLFLRSFCSVIRGLRYDFLYNCCLLAFFAFLLFLSHFGFDFNLRT